MQLPSALPMAVGSREASMDDSTDQQQQHDVPFEQRGQQHPMNPLRPVGGKARARQSYNNAGQRKVRKIDTSASSDEETGGHVRRAEWKETSWEPDEVAGATLQGDDNELLSHPHTPRHGTIEGEEDARSQLMEAEDAERSATVVLSSTVLLSPRGRARTPTILSAPADGSYFPGGAADRRTTSQDDAEDWAFSLSPRPRTAQGIGYMDRPTRYAELAASSPNTQDNDLKHHVTSMVSGIRVSYFCLGTLG